MALTLFCYRRDTTIIHKCPALIKLIILCVFSILLFKLNSWIFTCVFAMITFIVFFLAKTPIRQLRKLLYVPLIGGMVVLLRIIKFNPTYLDFSQVKDGFLYIAQFFVTTLAAQVFFDTTSTYQIQVSLEKIQAIVFKVFPFLKKINFALFVAITIHFIPLVFETWEKVNKAARSRIINRKIGIKNLLPVFFAFFSCLLQTAEQTRKAILNR